MKNAGEALTKATAGAKTFYRGHKRLVTVSGAVAAAGIVAASCSVYLAVPLALGAMASVIYARKMESRIVAGIVVGGAVVCLSGYASLVVKKNYLDAEQIPTDLSKKIATVCLKPGLAFTLTASAGKAYQARVADINIEKSTTIDASGNFSSGESYRGLIDVKYSFKNFYRGTRQTKTERIVTQLYTGPYLPNAQPGCWSANVKPR